MVEELEDKEKVILERLTKFATHRIISRLSRHPLPGELSNSIHTEVGTIADVLSIGEEKVKSIAQDVEEELERKREDYVSMLDEKPREGIVTLIYDFMKKFLRKIMLSLKERHAKRQENLEKMYYT